MFVHDLAAFIAELRAMLDDGSLLDVPPLQLSDRAETLLNVELGVRAMLAEVDFFATLTPEQKREPHIAARREKLARDLRAVQAARTPQA